MSPLVLVVFLSFFRFVMSNPFDRFAVSRVPEHASYSRTRRSDETFYLSWDSRSTANGEKRSMSASRYLPSRVKESCKLLLNTFRR